jgi:hypothetical protein
MARVVDNQSAGGADSLTINFEANADDYLILMHSRQYGTVPSTPTGWTALSYTKVEENGGKNEIWHKRATSTGSDSVTVSTTVGTGRHGLQLVNVRWVDATTAFDVTPTSRSSSSGATASSASITPSTANCLILHLVIPNDRTMIPAPGMLKLLRSNTQLQHGDAYSYYSYSKAAGATFPAITYTPELDLNINPTIVTIAFRDDGNNNSKGYVDVDNPPADIIHLLGTSGQTGNLTGTAQKDVTSAITTVQSISSSYNTNTLGAQQPSFEEGFLSSGVSTSGTTQSCGVIASELAATVDIDGDIIGFTSGGDRTFYQSFGYLAKNLAIGDGTNFDVFRVDAVDTVPSGSEAPILCVVEVGAGFENETVGAMSASVRQAIDHIVMISPAPTTYDVTGFGFLYRHNTMIILGGSTSFPCDMNTAIECARTSSLRTINNQGQQSQAQFFSAHKVQVGDGTTQTIWKSQQHSIEFPSASSEADRRIQVQVSAGKFGIYFKASSSCNFDFSNTTFNMGNSQVWELMSGTSTSATYSESGCLIISGDVRLQDIGRAIGGMTFSRCKEITKNSADCSGGNTFDNCNENQWFTVTSEAEFADLYNNTFKNNTVNAIKITGNQTGTWEDPNLTVSGNTYDIEYTGATDFNITSANTLTVNNSSTGTLTFITPVNTLTINSDTASTLIRYFEDDSQTVVDSATGTTLDYDYPDTDPIDIELVKQGYVPFNRQNVTPSNSDFDVVMDFDESYNSAHGLTITTEFDYVRATKVLNDKFRPGGS